jgi:histone-lysine N-methyltransferase SETD3
MLNHSSSAGRESCLKYDHSRGIAYLKSHKSYKEGEQVFDSYGPNPSPSQLLLDYGFVDEENQNYCVDLPVSMSVWI